MSGQAPHPPDDLRRRRLAYHEAGHAVVDVLTGRTVQKVTIVADEDCDGACHTDEDFDLDLVDFIAGFAAGRIAEAKAAHEMGLSVTDEASFYEGDAAAITSFQIDPDRRDEIHEAAEERAMRLVEDHWHLVERVAELLIHHGTVSGEQVHQIVGPRR